MEVLHNDSEDGKEEDDDDGIEGSSLTKPRPLAEALKSKPEVKKDKEIEQPTKERSPEARINEDDDTAPELDAIIEAPLGHLSDVETEAIVQTMASERLNEIQQAEEDVTSETLAAETFLENVEASGDVDRAYNETMIELGEAAIGSTPEAEIAEPVDPESLVQAAQSELAPEVSYRLRGSQVSAGEAPKSKQSYEAPAVKQPERSQKPTALKVHRGIVEYVVSRRFGRLKQESNRSDLESQLEHEVNDLQFKLVSHETHVRDLASNRNFEKKPTKAKELKPNKAETIGKVLVNTKEAERPTAHTIERAAISAHTMKHAELLNVAGSIDVENGNLRQIYESHLVGEKGLRRVVAEYLRGGNFKKVLRREILEKEKDFERDPLLRDQASTQPVATTHNDLDELLKRSGIDWNEPQPALGDKPKVKGGNLPALIQDFISPSNPSRRVADVIMFGIIAAMTTLILVLILAR